jgi:hypothetical protein
LIIQFDFRFVPVCLKTPFSCSEAKILETVLFYLLLLFGCRSINATISAIGVNFGIIRGVICCTLVIQPQSYHFIQSEGLRILVLLPESDYRYQ